jgi:hypothetical protein
VPDPQKLTVSASQAAALFNQHQYYTRWCLFQHFKNGLPLPGDREEDDRMLLGKLLQPVILELTARRYRLEVRENAANTYARRGPLGATIDGLMVAPDRGPMIVEAKNVDWKRWKDTWTETAAPIAIEIQTQVNMHCAGTEYGVIACLVGGNDPRFYERTLNRELIARVRDEAGDFLHSVERGIEPDPLGSPVELEMLAQLYPETDETEILEDYEDEELAILLRNLRSAQRERAINTKLCDQLKAKLLARAGNAGLVRTNGFEARIVKSETGPLICEPHTEPKIVRRSTCRTLVNVATIDVRFIRDVFGVE